MSQNSYEKQIHIASFLLKFLAKEGFKNWLTGADPEIQFEEDVLIAIHVRRPLEIPAKPVPIRDGFVVVEILLRFSKKQNLYLVEKFSVVGDTGNYMVGADVLTHYGKRLSGYADLRLSSTPECWTIANGSHVEALLKAYSRLALNTGQPAVFDLK